MAEKRLITAIDERGVARLTMNRPEVRNAFDETLIGDICAAMERLNADSDIRAIVVTGAGTVFSGGADLNMMKRVAGYSGAENKAEAHQLARMLTVIYASPKPTIALVNGPAMGGGLGLIAACDIAIGAKEAFFALAEARLGLIPAVISPYVIQAIGPRQARRYFVTAERFNASTAEKLGLLHITCPSDALEGTLGDMLGNILSCGPEAQREAKDLIEAVAGRDIDDSMTADTASRIARIRASDEGMEGMTAFLEKRKPRWKP